MRTFSGAVALAACLSLGSAPGASAQLNLAGSPLCSAFDGFESSSGSVSWTHCGGSFTGNDSNQNVAGWVLSNWSLEVSLNGKTEPGEDPGAFGQQFGQGGTTGTLHFGGSGISGLFVLSLKAANKFSLYAFDTGGESWTSLTYSTAGVSLSPGQRRNPQALSHASLYVGPRQVVVPEPATMLLLLTGLTFVGAGAARRRREGSGA